MTDSILPPELNPVRRANRTLLLFFLLAGMVFSLIFTELGMSDAVAFCLDAGVVLIALQFLLRGTTDSPSEVLKRYREGNLPAAVGVTASLLILSEGVGTFTRAFMPRLYAFTETLGGLTANSAWETAVLILGVAVLAPFYEELVFRGVALRAYRDARSTLFAVLFTGTLFGFIHGSIIHYLVIFPLGIVLALVMLKTGQLWTVIVAHGLYNFVITLLVEFNVPELPATPVFGVLGLAVAAATFWITVRYIGLPKGTLDRKSADRKSIWTFSLVVVLVLVFLVNAFTTYEALRPGVAVL